MPASDDFEALTDWAERLGLDEGQAENFISSSMRRLGHRPSVNWNDAEEGSDEGGSLKDFFGGGKAREQRQVRGQQGQGQQRQRRGGGSDWQYPDRTG
jgi:hypothetical protein